MKILEFGGCYIFRFDRFTEAFEHVSGVIDDIYKVYLPSHQSKGTFIIVLYSMYRLFRNFLIIQVLKHFWVLTMEK